MPSNIDAESSQACPRGRGEQRDSGETTNHGGGRATRRRLLATGVAALAGLAGCSGEPDSSSPTPADSPVVSPDTPTEIPTDPGPAPALSGRWPTVYADEANTGAVDLEGPLGTPAVRWQGGVDLETGMWVSEGPDGPVAVREDGRVVAYDADGDRRWTRQHPGKFFAAPVVTDNGTAVVGDRDGTITAYEADGSRRWRRTTMEGVYAPHANDATPLQLADDVVVLAHPRGEAIAFDLETGATQWSVDVPRRCHQPVVEDGHVFLVGNADDRRESLVLSLSLADGSTAWSVELAQSIRIGLGYADGTLYHGDIDGLLVARDAADGSEQWRVRLSENTWISTIPQAFGGRIWVGTLDGGLYAVTEAGVDIHVEDGGTTTPAVGDGRLYVGSSVLDDSGGVVHSVVAFDADGSERWRTRLRGRPNAQLVYREGRVVTATETGFVDAYDAETGQRAWRTYERADQVPSPVVGDGAVYCGSERGWVNGFRATDGTSHLWGLSFDLPAPAAPVVAGDTVLVGSHGGGVAGVPTHEYADPPTDRLTATPTTGPTETDIHIDAPLPEPRWRIDLDGPVGDFGYGDDGAYVGSGDAVVALTAAGDVRWTTNVGARVREAPATVDDAVYAATAGGTLFALAAATGKEQWRATVGETATAPAVTSVDDGQTIVVGTGSGVVAVAADSGEERWRAETAHVRGSPALTGDLAIVGDEAGLLRGLALSDGEERWRVETGGAIHGAPAVGGDHAYVGSRDRRLYAVAVEDGAVAWRTALGDWVDGSPAIGYGAVFVVDQSGRISAVHGDA